MLMLVLNSQIIGKPVQSIHTGSPIASLVHAIVDYRNLQVIAYDVAGPLTRQENLDVLMTKDIREFIPHGAIVDSIDSLGNSEDIVAVSQIKEVRFDPLNLRVKTKSGKNIGRVSDLVIDTTDFMIHQIIVRRPVLQSFIDPELTISRDLIIEVTDYDIVIKDDKEKPKAKRKAEKESFIPNYVNPFKQPEFAGETNSTSD